MLLVDSAVNFDTKSSYLDYLFFTILIYCCSFVYLFMGDLLGLANLSLYLSLEKTGSPSLSVLTNCQQFFSQGLCIVKFPPSSLLSQVVLSYSRFLQATILLRFQCSFHVINIIFCIRSHDPLPLIIFLPPLP